MFNSITLEMSLKPFKKTDDDYIRSVCREVFSGWRQLIKNRETVSIMLWAADGSEILDYSGDLSEPFEWAYFMGTANLPEATESDPAELSLHTKKRKYMPNPPVMTYGILKRIVEIIKEEGKKACPGSTVRVGETFDIGPEFAISDFKYNRHTEICLGATLDHHGFVDSTSRLKSDTRKYAAYPSGIPEGLKFGTFLGKQSEVFCRDMGFDFLWLSNGLGFSANPWDKTGKIFDGTRFYPEKLPDTRAKVFEFWKLFREAAPSLPLETRGTNNSAGIDYTTDGVPLFDVYRAGFDIAPPPNSPWAALNGNYGLEIMGHMTRICELPSKGFLFRYYIHDPWWVNTPWYDRYESSAGDIYMPMAISRIDEEGKTESASRFNILSIDNTFGEMPDHCINEPLPHILKAEKNAPDTVAPFVWVYPLREYTSATAEEELCEIYYGDTFIQDAINDGFPLNCVVSADNFLNHPSEIYQSSILIAPPPKTQQLYEKFREIATNGVNIIFYGSKKALKACDSIPSSVCVAFNDGAGAMREAAAKFGYNIHFTLSKTAKKPPTMTVHRSDGATFFSSCNTNTLTEISLRFPLGAPILLGLETELKNGASTYRFGRCEHRECRVFVEQTEGEITAKEIQPVSARFRRKMMLTGLQNATVRFFPESYCKSGVYYSSADVISDDTPDPMYEMKDVRDPKNGDHFVAEGVTGDFYFMTPYRTQR